MNYRHRVVPIIVLLALVVPALLSSCGAALFPGRSYVAIDWVAAPEAMHFPEFPQIITAGEYVQHQAGSYYGEYVAWDGSYWTVTYTVEVDEGSPGLLLMPGLDGRDAYWTLWLYSFGPSYYRDRSLTSAVPDQDEFEEDYDGDTGVGAPPVPTPLSGRVRQISNLPVRGALIPGNDCFVTRVDVQRNGGHTVRVVSTGRRQYHRLCE